MWIDIGLIADNVAYTGGVAERKSVPGYPNSVPSVSLGRFLL
jgi:hypothetical protein